MARTAGKKHALELFLTDSKRPTPPLPAWALNPRREREKRERARANMEARHAARIAGFGGQRPGMPYGGGRGGGVMMQPGQVPGRAHGRVYRDLDAPIETPKVNVVYREVVTYASCVLLATPVCPVTYARFSRRASHRSRPVAALFVGAQDDDF